MVAAEKSKCACFAACTSCPVHLLVVTEHDFAQMNSYLMHVLTSHVRARVKYFMEGVEKQQDPVDLCHQSPSAETLNLYTCTLLGLFS